MDPISIGLGAASLLGGLFSRQSRAPRMSYSDIDPNRYAEKRYNELTDRNSAYNRGQYNNLLRMSLSASPSLDALLGAQAGGGGSASIAQAQARANAGRGREAAFNAHEGQRGQTEQLAQGYLGIHEDINKMVGGANFGAGMEEFKYQNSFSNQLMGMGGGLLGIGWLGNQQQDPGATQYNAPTFTPDPNNVSANSGFGPLGSRESPWSGINPNTPGGLVSGNNMNMNVMEGLNYGESIKMPPWRMPQLGESFGGNGPMGGTYGARPQSRQQNQSVALFVERQADFKKGMNNILGLIGNRPWAQNILQGRR